MIAKWDRLDPTKGIPEGLQAFKMLLDRHPELKGNVVFYVTIETKRRQDLPAYKILNDEYESLVKELNSGFNWDGFIRSDEDMLRLKENDMPPVIVDVRQNKTWHAQLVSADVVLTNPVADGMNLVVKGAAVLNNPNFISDLFCFV